MPDPNTPGDPSLAHQLNNLVNYITHVWAQTYTVPAQLIHFCPNARLLMLPPFDDVTKLWTAHHLLPHLADLPETQAIIFIAEAWAIKIPKGDSIATLPRPRDCPDRQEIVNALIYTPESTTAINWQINRPDTGPPTLSPPEVSTQPTHTDAHNGYTFSNPFVSTSNPNLN